MARTYEVMALAAFGFCLGELIAFWIFILWGVCADIWDWWKQRKEAKEDEE